MFEQVQHQEQRPVAAAPTQGAADLLVATLRVHGVQATTAMASVYPSLDWVAGIAITVADEDVDRAREILRDLGHEPI